MNHHQYKLLATDIDGTLIKKDGTISPRTRRALAEAINSGMHVSLATGRSLKSSLTFMKQLSLNNFHIFFDGALVSNHNPDEAIYSRPIDPNLVRQMISYAHKLDINLELYTPSQFFSESETWSTETHRRFFGIEATITKFDGIWQNETIIKCGLVIVDPQNEAKAQLFCSHFANSLYFSYVTTPAYPNVTFINLLAPDTSKGTALESLAAHMGISMTEIVAAGDGKNDIPAFAKAGLGIAMGNAHEELKKVADHITLDVEADGLAAAIEELLL